MYYFDFWFAYFDSLFIKPNINLHASFLNTLNLQSLVNLDFPICKKLPQISNCFQQFEKFLLKQDNWIQSGCEHTTLKQIERNISLILIVINVEKKYGLEFWQSKRRIQSTICHFFSLFNFFLYTLIPNNIDTMQNSKRLNKLCTSLKQLLNLVNIILPQMNPIIKFLHQECFAQQRKLTILFLQQIRNVLLNLPKIHRQKIKFEFQLSKYLHVITPIQIYKSQYKLVAKRKKTATIANLPKIRYSNQQSQQTFGRKQPFQEHYQEEICSLISLGQKRKILNIRAKIFKINQKNSVDVSKAEIQGVLNREEILPVLFQFSQKVRKHSFQLYKKKITKTTIKTRQTLQLKFGSEKQGKKSQFLKRTNSHSIQNNIGRSLKIGRQLKLQNQGQITNRSKKQSFQQLHKSIQIKQSQKYRPHKQICPLKQRVKHQLSTKQIIKKPQEQIYPLIIPTKIIQLSQGKSKGWGTVQHDVNLKILKKKIHDLIYQDPQ